MLYHLAKHLVSASLVSFGLLAVILSLFALLRICRRPILKLPTATLVVLSIFAVISASVADKTRDSGQTQNEGLPTHGLRGDNIGEPSEPGVTNEASRFLFTHVERGTNGVELAAAWTTNDVFVAMGLYYTQRLESNEWNRIDLRFDVANSTNCAWTITDPAMVTNAAGFFRAKGFLATGDDDFDGVTNARELLVGTALDLADTDGDGLTDGEEIGYATILPDDEFLWLNASNGVAGVSHYRSVSGDFGYLWFT